MQVLADGWLWSLALCVSVRACASVLRAHRANVPFRAASALFVGVAAWAATPLFDAWVPLWVALLGGALLAVGGRRLQEKAPASAAAEAFLVLVLGAAASPGAISTAAVVVSIAFGITGVATDAIAARVPRWAGVAGLLFVLGVIAWRIEAGDTLKRVAAGDPTLPLFLAVAGPDAGERVDLDGAVVWRFHYRSPTAPVAVMFHGAHVEGSRQPAAVALQRAFRAAGVEVWSLDHAGYGASPSPVDAEQVEAWDPSPAQRRLFERVRSDSGRGRPVLLVGHSMGTTEVLRALSAPQEPIASAFIFGGASSDLTSRADYWYERFHHDRRLRAKVPRSTFEQLQRRYYDRGALAARIRPGVAPIYFVEAEFEHADVIARRAPLYAALPAPKERVSLPGSDHYFNTARLGRLVLADTRVSARVAAIVSERTR